MNAALPLPSPEMSALPQTELHLPEISSEHRRYLSLDLSRLSTDRLTRARLGPRWRCAAHEIASPGLLVIVGRRDNADRLVALNEEAERAGLRVGQGLADARAILPFLEVAPEDRAADRRLLEAIADWCDRYTPLVAIEAAQSDAPDGNLAFGLVLDITGCAHLFGGEAALAADLLARLFHIGFAARAAIAPTPGAAWALARFGEPARPQPASFDKIPHAEAGATFPGIAPYAILQPDELAEALAPLPVAALRLDGETVSGLARLGLRRIGQVLARPRAPIARRFGRTLLARLDQALGLADEPVSPRRPAPLLSAERRLAEPIAIAPDIVRLVARLALHLEKRLAARGEGARRLDLTLWRLDGHVARLGVGTALPVRDPEKIVRLFGERLTALGEAGDDDFDPGYGFDMARLSVAMASRLDERQQSLLARDSEAERLANLTDRLGARLGIANVAVGRPADTHLPERAETIVPVFEAGLPMVVAGPTHMHLPPPLTPPHKGEGDRRRALPPPCGEAGEPSVSEGEPVGVRGQSSFGFPHAIVTASMKAPAALQQNPPLPPLRPLRLFERPEPVEAMAEIPDGPPLRFRWRRLLRQVVRAEGPERIAPQWWVGGWATGTERPIRDYFRIEDTEGRRYWLFREGRFGETPPPRWFVHGLFA